MNPDIIKCNICSDCTAEHDGFESGRKDIKDRIIEVINEFS